MPAAMREGLRHILFVVNSILVWRDVSAVQATADEGDIGAVRPSNITTENKGTPTLSGDASPVWMAITPSPFLTCEVAS